MAQTYKRTHDRYTLAFKQQAVRLADQLNVTAIEIANALGIHPVMLYRWRMELKNGTLCENQHMKKAPAPKKQRKRSDPAKANDDKLLKAAKRIKDLERTLASTQEELDILKKARRFFEKTKQ